MKRVSVAAAIAASSICACQTPSRPDPSLALAVFEVATPQRPIRDFGENRRFAASIYAGRVVELPEHGSRGADNTELSQLELRFTDWCQQTSPRATPGSYPYGKDTLIQDISAAVSSQAPPNAPLLVYMGPDGRSIVGAYAINHPQTFPLLSAPRNISLAHPSSGASRSLVFLLGGHAATMCVCEVEHFANFL